MAAGTVHFGEALGFELVVAALVFSEAFADVAVFSQHFIMLLLSTKREELIWIGDR